MSLPALSRLSVRDLLCSSALQRSDIDRIYQLAAALKADRTAHTELLRHKRLAMIFEKDSLRTRFTFDIGMQDLGGSAVFMDHRDARLGSRESIRDVARNLERWVHGVVVRTFKHKLLEELAQHAAIPVINGLTDTLHPCQALTDCFTLTERWGSLRGRTVTFVGDGNNTCHSLLLTAARLGAKVRIASPEGYEPEAPVVATARTAAHETGGKVDVLNDPLAAADGADVIYTDTWTSMGWEDEIEERNSVFAPFRVDEALMARAKPGAFFLHCLPAHRGWEVTPEVIDGPQSIVFDNAENRLHVQKAILALLLHS